MRSRNAHGARRGLSLLELLVSLALLSLIAGGLASAFGIGTQVFDRARALDGQQEELAARRQLRAAVTQILPMSRLTPFPNQFAGAPDRLSFVTLMDAPYAPQAAALTFEVTWTGQTLTMDVAAIDETGVPGTAWSHVLSRDVRNVSFQYLDTSGDTPAWVPVWSDRPDLPALIRITAEGGQPRWVEFTVGPRL